MLISGVEQGDTATSRGREVERERSNIPRGRAEDLSDG